MFLAPVLYAIHAVLTGLSLAICSALGIHLGFTFSAGAIDYVLNYGLSQRGWLAIPIGLVYGLVYYGLFRFFIRKFNMATPGREPATTDAEVESFDNTGFVSPTAGATVPRAVALHRRFGRCVEPDGRRCLHDASASCRWSIRRRCRNPS